MLEAFLQLPPQLCLVSFGWKQAEGQFNSMAKVNRNSDSSASNSNQAEHFPLKLEMTGQSIFQYPELKTHV